MRGVAISAPTPGEAPCACSLAATSCLFRLAASSSSMTPARVRFPLLFPTTMVCTAAPPAPAGRAEEPEPNCRELAPAAPNPAPEPGTGLDTTTSLPERASRT
ncbi:hypothetical protein BD311DRAFT_747447 [Dichomitus squalens]|uniref:Uncharacterized protein n=1 Tax=Dichomitus squalens TaxID=114155 RepID=A0A4Q9N1C6_9APHY|nr:hypothetical protein BD311DRAFT_747447 [Dichomitus squalens]